MKDPIPRRLPSPNWSSMIFLVLAAIAVFAGALIGR